MGASADGPSGNEGSGSHGHSIRSGIVAGAVAIVVIAVVGLLVALRASDDAVAPVDAAPAQSPSSTAPKPPPPTIECADHVYGERSTCTVTSAEGLSVRWADTSTSEVANGTASATVRAAGVVVAEVHDADDVVASAEYTITPDVSVSCESGELAPVYEITADDSAMNGWNYVYLDPIDGRRVEPGEPDFPVDPGLTDKELIVVDEVEATGKCSVISAAVADLEDTDFEPKVMWQTDLPYEEPLRIRLSAVVPFSRSKWHGVQPGTVTALVSVGDVTASERVGVYLSGCT